MTGVMAGVRILEVAEHTFVPLAFAILSDWGAEVIKIEHVERGDAARGLATSSGVQVGGGGVELFGTRQSRKAEPRPGPQPTEGREILYNSIGVMVLARIVSTA